MPLLKDPTRLLFFTGKGGVGKTSLACATAVALADQGRQVLLVSTDPASNLGQVFGVSIGEHAPTPIPNAPGLFALNINPEAAAQAYRDRIVGPLRGVLPAESLKGMEEQLSGACTTEIAAFDEFTGLLTDSAATNAFDHVIFDTAPTGHTLRLLQLPTAWTNYLESNSTGASCLGPLSGLQKQQQQYAQAVAELANGKATTVVIVARPQHTSLAEADRTSHELAMLGIVNQQLVINGGLPARDRVGSSGDGDIRVGEVDSDPLAAAMRRREAAAMRTLPAAVAALPIFHVPLQPWNMVGLSALRALLSGNRDERLPRQPAGGDAPQSLPALSALIDAIELSGHGLVMVLGKGGVGKTTVAAALAVALADRGHAVLLTTTDPAAHLTMTVEANVRNLAVSRIDPQVERDRYRRQVLETSGKQLDEAGRRLLEEDLRSPCTEEIAVFQAFSRVMRESREKFVVVDTAPTGHTLLLLDATGSYHREVIRHAQPGSHVVTPLMRLQDPSQTKMVIVTLPETTPVLEAESLQSDLRRAGIEPWAWVVNASLAAAAPRDPLLVARAAAELPHLERVRELAARLAIIPWVADEPVGSEQLLKLTRSNTI